MRSKCYSDSPSSQTESVCTLSYCLLEPAFKVPPRKTEKETDLKISEFQCISSNIPNGSVNYTKRLKVYLINPLKPSGHYMYRTVVTKYTTSLTFNNFTFCYHSAVWCCVFGSQNKPDEEHQSYNNNNNNNNNNNIIKFINCNWVVTRWQWLFYMYTKYEGDHGGAVVKVLCYKSEGRWFDPSWCQWIFH